MEDTALKLSRGFGLGQTYLTISLLFLNGGYSPVVGPMNTVPFDTLQGRRSSGLTGGIQWIKVGRQYIIMVKPINLTQEFKFWMNHLQAE